MDKQEIDIYLNKINEAQSESEKLRITNEFLDLVYKSVGYVNKYGQVGTYKNTTDIMNYLVETSAVSIINEIGATHVPGLSYLMGEIVNRSNASNKESEAEKINNYVDKLLSDPELLPDNPTDEQFVIYDLLLLRSVKEALRKDIPIAPNTKIATSNLFLKLPNPTDFRTTFLYSRAILDNMQEREDVKNLIPKLSIEDYREMIGLLDGGDNFFEYDNTVNEYLSFYGESEEVDFEEKERLFFSIVDKVGVGNLINSNTYSKYFMKTETKENIGFLYAKRSVIMRDVLARIFESEGTDFRTIETEKDYFESFFLPHNFKSQEEEQDEEFTYEGEFQEMLSSLFRHGGEYWDDVAKYSIRLKNIFDNRNRPQEPFLAKVYDHIKSLEIYDSLRENLNPEKLEEVDPNKTPSLEELFKMAELMGVPFTEEERNRRTEFENEMRNSGYNPNVNRNGLRRIDAADIALSLMLEADPEKAILEFHDKQNINSFSQYGRNIYDSRASRKLIEIYIDNKIVNPDKQAEPLIKEIVNQITSNPNFNIINEREISELLQLGYLERNEFGKEILDLVRSNLDKNPSYQISNEEAKNNVDEFIKKVGTNPIDIDQEVEFDKFLVSLTKMRVDSKDGIMPEEAIDFLINQSLRPDSIINLKNDKYERVAERAVEDLGKRDLMTRAKDKRLEYIYITREYINKANIEGEQSIGNRSITIKESVLKKLQKGDLHAINALFHENTHAIRRYKMVENSEEFTDYLIKKEDHILRAEGGMYYKQNYRLFLEEVEAREIAARLTAEYIGKIISQNQVVDLADSLKQSVTEGLISSFEEQRQAYSREAIREFNSYRKGLSKIDRNGQISTINDIFDRNLQEGNINFLLFSIMEPMAIYEYNFLGNRKSFPEQINTVVSEITDDEKKLDFIRAIINYSGTAKDADALQTLTAINNLIDVRGEKDSNISKFITEIVGPNLPDILSRYGKASLSSLKNGQEPTDDMIGVYQVIQNIAEKIKSEPDGAWTQGFMTPNSKGKHSLELMCIYSDMMKRYVPDIDKKVEPPKVKEPDVGKKGFADRIKNAISGIKSFFGYRQFAEVKADVEGKNDAKKFESDLVKKEKDSQKRTEIL